MPQITVETLSGELQTIDAATNQTLLDVIRDAGISDLLALCGGCCSCATCHVYVDEGSAKLPPISLDEDGLLEGAHERRANSRLSCQLLITDTLDGLRVAIAPAE